MTSRIAAAPACRCNRFRPSSPPGGSAPPGGEESRKRARRAEVRERPPRRSPTGTMESGTMSTAMAMPGNTTSTYLVHLFGTGLADERFVVEKFRALANGEIRPVAPEAAASRGRRAARRVVVSRRQAEAMRPDRTEIIVCTGLTTRGGRQAWGSVAAGLLCDRRQRG